MKIKISDFAIVIALLALSACKSNNSPKQQFITLSNIDSSVKPGNDFYDFVNGKWIKTATIPSTESGVGSFLDLRNRTRTNLKSILGEVSNANNPAGSIEQKVGDFYASGLDTVTIEKRGYEPIKPEIEKINSLKTANDVMKFIIDEDNKAESFLFPYYVSADDKNSNMNIVCFAQGGLGMPDRDYYLKNDAPTIAVQQAYKKYVQKLFMLTGDDSTTAVRKMNLVYNFEKSLAPSHKTNVELRDPQSNYHKMAVADLDKQMPVFAWKTTLTALKINVDSINLCQPEYYKKLNEIIESTPIDTWKAYLKFHLLNNAAGALTGNFENTQFEYDKILSGQKQLKPRWERMVMATDANLGEALGQLYVKKYFTKDAKKRMVELVNNLQKAFANRINHLDWMSDSTKQKAVDKLNAFTKKIGYPDKWKDYSSVSIDRAKYFENLQACSLFEYHRMMDKIGKPVDKTEWGMTPPTINAYYNPLYNEIVFPAGILQFPFFDAGADDAVNYGGIGMVIGHEMTHGFDDQGAQYDKNGNLKNWWNKEDEAKFKVKTKQVIDLYNSFTILDTLHVNGSLTTGENMADIGGVAIAYDAFKLTKQGQDTTRIDGFTPDQRFFLSIAQIWRQKIKDERARYLINIDPHSPPKYRVLGPLMNFTPFYQAFDVKQGDKMFVPEDKRIKIW